MCTKKHNISVLTLEKGRISGKCTKKHNISSSRRGILVPSAEPSNENY
jgi:hypothetical protein